MRAFGVGIPGTGFCAVVLGVFVAIFALCGIQRCMRCRIRDCHCIKRLMRISGADKFDDFELMVIIHDVTFTSKDKMNTLVRVSAGHHSVKTDFDSRGNFQQALSIYVEQGTQEIRMELMGGNGRTVLACLKLDVSKDIKDAKDIHTLEKVFTMKQKTKGVLNPRIKLSIATEGTDEEQAGLLSGMAMSHETDMMLRQHLHKVNITSPKGPGLKSELDILAQGCAGPLDMFGSWGSKEQVWVSVDGPPEAKKYCLGVWKDRGEYEKGVKPQHEVILLKVLSVQPDPNRPEVFMLQYLDPDKVKKRLQFRRIDRARDVWVEMLQMLIKQVHDAKNKQKEQKRR